MEAAAAAARTTPQEATVFPLPIKLTDPVKDVDASEPRSLTSL
jgi:hypothetical protein